MSHTRSCTVAALAAAIMLPLVAGGGGPSAVGAFAQAPGGSQASGLPQTQSGHAPAPALEALTAGPTTIVPTLATAATGPGITAGPTTHWVSPNAKFVVKAQFTTDGKPAVAKGAVVLQQKFGSSWVTVGKPAKLNAKGEATLAAISEDLQVETSYRVVSGDLTSNAFTVQLGAGKHTAFKLFKGSPRWQPCTSPTAKEPIVYQFNLAKAPADWTTAQADIEAAIADVSAQTGLVFEAHSTATTTKFPTKTGLAFDSGVDMVIAAGSATDSNVLPAKASKVLAVGGFSAPAANGFITKGYVMIDNRQKVAGGDPVAGKSTWQMVLRHELAHALGVMHPSDTKQVMNPTYNNIVTGWGAGDLNALQVIGVRAPKTMVYGQAADSCAAVAATK